MSHGNITFYPSQKASLGMTQLEPLALIANGLPVKTVSHRLCKADPTINHHLLAARQHYGAKNLAHAVALAMANGDITFKAPSNYTSTLRCGAVAFMLLAAVTSILDTPFVGDADHSAIRTRHVKGHRGGKRDVLDTLIV